MATGEGIVPPTNGGAESHHHIIPALSGRTLKEVFEQLTPEQYEYVMSRLDYHARRQLKHADTHNQEEVVAETLAGACRYNEEWAKTHPDGLNFPSGGHFMGFLYGIMNNKVADFWRRQSRNRIDVLGDELIEAVHEKIDSTSGIDDPADNLAVAGILKTLRESGIITNDFQADVFLHMVYSPLEDGQMQQLATRHGLAAVAGRVQKTRLLWRVRAVAPRLLASEGFFVPDEYVEKLGTQTDLQPSKPVKKERLESLDPQVCIMTFLEIAVHFGLPQNVRQLKEGLEQLPSAVGAVSANQLLAPFRQTTTTKSGKVIHKSHLEVLCSAALQATGYHTWDEYLQARLDGTVNS